MCSNICKYVRKYVNSCRVEDSYFEKNQIKGKKRKLTPHDIIYLRKPFMTYLKKSIDFQGRQDQIQQILICI